MADTNSTQHPDGAHAGLLSGAAMAGGAYRDSLREAAEAAGRYHSALVALGSPSPITERIDTEQRTLQAWAANQ